MTNPKSESIDNLIVAFLEEKITADEFSVLKAWLAVSTDNKEYFRKYVKSWKYASVQGNAEFNPAKAFSRLQYKLHHESSNIENNTDIPRLKDRQFLNLLMKWAAVALLFLACGALLFIGIRYLIPSSPWDLATYEINVPNGSKSHITLPDGSQVWLNAGSKLSYDARYGKKTRDLYLSGEGYFVVAKNPFKPMTVHTSKATIKALGTEFNVKAYPDEDKIETLLVEGSVVVEELEATGSGKNLKTEKTFVLTPGEKAVIFTNPFTAKEKEEVSPDKKEAKKIARLDPKPAASVIKSESMDEITWKSPRWAIKEKSMGELKVLLERHYNVKITEMDDSLAKYKFTGTIENETIEEVMNILSLTMPVQWSINKGNVTLKYDESLLEKYRKAYN